MKYTRGYWKGVRPDGRKFKVASKEEAERISGERLPEEELGGQQVEKGLDDYKRALEAGSDSEEESDEHREDY